MAERHHVVYQNLSPKVNGGEKGKRNSAAKVQLQEHDSRPQGSAAPADTTEALSSSSQPTARIVPKPAAESQWGLAGQSSAAVSVTKALWKDTGTVIYYPINGADLLGKLFFTYR